MTGILHENLQKIMAKFRSVLLRMRHDSDKRCRGNQNTHFTFSILFSKIMPFMKKNEKYGTAIQATGDNIGLMQHRKDAICMPDN
jgi:hypothetical protein